MASCGSITGQTNVKFLHLHKIYRGRETFFKSLEISPLGSCPMSSKEKVMEQILVSIVEILSLWFCKLRRILSLLVQNLRSFVTSAAVSGSACYIWRNIRHLQQPVLKWFEIMLSCHVDQTTCLMKKMVQKYTVQVSSSSI